MIFEGAQVVRNRQASNIVSPGTDARGGESVRSRLPRKVHRSVHARAGLGNAELQTPQGSQNSSNRRKELAKTIMDASVAIHVDASAKFQRY